MSQSTVAAKLQAAAAAIRAKRASRYVSAYCPSCDQDLRAMSAAQRSDDGHVVTYSCVCGHRSHWSFSGSQPQELGVVTFGSILGHSSITPISVTGYWSPTDKDDCDEDEP